MYWKRSHRHGEESFENNDVVIIYNKIIQGFPFVIQSTSQGRSFPIAPRLNWSWPTVIQRDIHSLLVDTSPNEYGKYDP